MIGIIPSVNLVRNLGFDERSTHTKSNKKLYSIKSHKINFPLKHNNESLINKKLLLNEYNKIYKTGLIHDFKKFIHKIL